jgi:hypothetical protein
MKGFASSLCCWLTFAIFFVEIMIEDLLKKERLRCFIIIWLFIIFESDLIFKICVY